MRSDIPFEFQTIAFNTRRRFSLQFVLTMYLLGVYLPCHEHLDRSWSINLTSRVSISNDNDRALDHWRDSEVVAQSEWLQIVLLINFKFALLKRFVLISQAATEF